MDAAGLEAAEDLDALVDLLLLAEPLRDQLVREAGFAAGPGFHLP
jgi:hypothetical protein